MSSPKYIFDAAQGVFRKSVHTVSGILIAVLKYVLAAAALAVVWYVLFALLINTDSEKKLRDENRFYAQSYEKMRSDVELLEAVVAGLEIRDDAINEDVFRKRSTHHIYENASSELEDSISDAMVHSFISKRVAETRDIAAKVDANFRQIFSMLEKDSCVVPPLSAPLQDFSVKRVGATTGQRYSPFLNMELNHNGLDIIAPSGSAVLASADGVVLSVTRSNKGEGNVVTLEHEGGYYTRYAHLGSISVKAGNSVKKGQQIATIGMSGMSYAPHLHYEVIRDSVLCNPANYLFLSVSPYDYPELFAVSSSTAQSLD